MYEVQGTLTSPTPPPHPISSVATCNVVNDPRDLSSVAMDHVRSTRYVNIPHPPHPTPPQHRDLQKCAFYSYGFRGVSKNMQAQKHSIITCEGRRRTALRSSKMVHLRCTNRQDHHPEIKSG